MTSENDRVEFPSELELLFTRVFAAPIELVFAVTTRPEHVRKWFSGPGEEMTTCTIDLRVGGDYHFVFLTADGKEMSFRGTYLEIEPPRRTVQTWRYEGWADTEAVETMKLRESGGLTTLTWHTAFADRAGRDHMTQYDGILESFDRVAALLDSLL